MEWSPQQANALDAIKRWHDDGPMRPFVLHGYAGTGKTTIARHIAETIGGDVPFCAFTGKAASVLRRKGCSTATTIHQLIYQPKVRSRARLRELQEELAKHREDGSDEWLLMQLQRQVDEERRILDQPLFSKLEESAISTASVVIVDECSMVDERIGSDLASFGVPIIALGDPGQLPPVGGRPYFSREPDVMLDEIHRQAKDNPIIHLATLARRGAHIPFGEYGSSRVLPWGSMDADEAIAHDQILVGRNKTRHASNQRVREILGFSGELPSVNERLVCLRNNHDIGLMNGSTWTVDDVVGVPGCDIFSMSIRDPDFPGEQHLVEAYVAPFRGERLPFWEKDAELFEFGYALTVHKSQGSEWKDVLVFDESSVFRGDAPKHLYTAITRASERVTLVL